MALRRLVGVVGIIVLLVGLGEIVFPAQVLSLTESMMRPAILRLIGAFELVLGVLLVAAAIRREVRLQPLVLILGIWLIVVSAVMFAAPEFLMDLTNAILLYRPKGFQIAVLWASGLLRIVLGGALIWASLRPPDPVHRPQVEHQ